MNGVHAQPPLLARPMSMRFAGKEIVSLWLAFTYFGSNIVFNTLNFYWFGKMIEAVRKRSSHRKSRAERRSRLPPRVRE